MTARLCLATAATTFLLFAATAFGEAPAWHPSLCLPGEGCWQGRIRVVVHNETESPLVGRPVAIRVGNETGQAELMGEEAKAIRVCDEQGTEFLFAIVGPQGQKITSGSIPQGSQLIVPADCDARSSRDYFVYYDNPSAWEVPDHLRAHIGLVNGDLEEGASDTPIGWSHDAADEQHRASWSDKYSQSGKRCLKTVVAQGAEPTWIATRQHDIAIDGGARYRMTAWVKAENVVGEAGWYIHVGNQQQPMQIGPVLRGGGGTYDWKQLSTEFTAPRDADRADLGTVLRGTGKAWFDNVTLTRLDPAKVRAVADKPERLKLTQHGANARWPEDVAGGIGWDQRAKVKVFNFGHEPIENALVCIDLAYLAARCRGKLQHNSLRVTFGRAADKNSPPLTLLSPPLSRTAGGADGTLESSARLGQHDLPYLLLGDRLAFQHDLPAASDCSFYIYFSADSRIPPPDRAAATTLVAGNSNLVKNPSFEKGSPLPEQWISGASATPDNRVRFAVDSPGAPGHGARCAKLVVDADAPLAWRGWQQRVPVDPGQTYLYAAWVRGKDLSGKAWLHAHCHTRDGKLCEQHPLRSAGPQIEGTSKWTLMSGLLPMPPDAAALSLHLTMNTTGTLWHDGVVVAKVVPGRIVGFEGRPVKSSDELQVWPVNSVVKVFPDEPVPREKRTADISLARNEKETLQLAVRGSEDLQDVRVIVDPFEGPGGARLKQPAVNVVGYVPIDYPTSYYRAETPRWHRKVPTYQPGCDGWPGWWPDPLLPQDTFDLSANKTQAVWITVAAGRDTPAGEYVGRVRLVSGERSLVEIPVRVGVWDFDLPDKSHLAAIYDVRTGPGREHWGKAFDGLYRDLVQFLAERRLCADRIYPDPTIAWRDGRVVADFTKFDEAAKWYFDELNLPRAYMPQQFYLFGWGHPPKRASGRHAYPGEYPYTDADRNQLTPEYKEAYQACLKEFWNHVKQQGWADRFVLYISDEPHDQQPGIIPQMQALCDMIHEVDPTIPIYSSTWKHVPQWNGYLDVWGIGHYGRVPVDNMQQMRARGDRLWFTTDGQMCTDTPYCAVERLLPHYCFKYGVEAYEFWGASWLTYDPFRYGWHAYIHQSSRPGTNFFVRYPNGDGFLIYPGKPLGHDGLVSTIRLEQAREGVEDYEYLYLLRQLTAVAKEAGLDVREAQRAFDEASQLVTIPNAGGRYSSAVLPEPDAVLRVRQSVAQAIEDLSRRMPEK